MIWVIIGIFILIFIVMFPLALIKVARAKKIKCPNCERDIKLVNTVSKCPFCKTKLFKHADGDYRIRP